MADHAIHAHVADLRHELHRLVDARSARRIVNRDGTSKSETHMTPSIIEEIRDAMGGAAEGVMGHGTATSRPPLWLDALRWLNDVERDLKKWVVAHRIPVKGTTLADLVYSVIAADFSPEDEERVEKYVRKVRGWVNSGETLVSGHTFGLRGHACPDCHVEKVRRRTLDGWGDANALQASSDSIRCLSCRRVWAPEEFMWLGRRLGCEESEDLLPAT